MKDFSKLCTPSKIYFAIAVISIILFLFNGLPIMMIFTKIVFALLWTFILDWLCKKGYKTISWFLVLLPYIIIALAMLNIYHVTYEQRQLMRTVGLQGAYGQEAFTEGNRNRGASGGKTGSGSGKTGGGGGGGGGKP
jgi:uncharacterized membrane protein YgcG